MKYTIKELRERNCSPIISKNGVYIVSVPDDFQVQFSNNTTAMRTFKIENDMLYDVSALREKYDLSNQRILYIGKAQRKGGVHARVKELVRYGINQCKTHRGGRAIWQITNNENLLVEAIPLDDTKYTSAREMEHAMLLEYTNLPVGNRKY